MVVMRRRLCLCGLLLAIAAPAIGVTSAHADNDQDRAREKVQSGEIRPLQDVLRSVRRQVPGRVLGARLVDFGGSLVYQIRLLTADGRVVEVTADARSGGILDIR
jgi:uncharacterized membrane protein YkoI